MNPRIQELAEESGMTQYVAANNKYLERFAELLIRECMMLSVLQSEAGYVSNYIAKHFGIKP